MQAAAVPPVASTSSTTSTRAPAGSTPRCNAWIKFGRLFEHADMVGASHVATGHYARLAIDAVEGPVLRRGRDAARDQSYVLFDVPAERLRRMLLPVGGLAKEEVRQRAPAASRTVSGTSPRSPTTTRRLSASIRTT